MIDRNLAKTREIAEKVRKLGGRTFFAGGFVRDRLLGLESKDVDIEVHGIEADKLSELLRSMGNVRTQGKSFGIYSLGGYDIDIALPRKERNTGRGHRDFEVFTDPHLGTEAAARRRDFTINSMMEDVLTGEVVDHFRGIEDLEKGIIRHIDSESFREDPLRVLRGARFAARFGFTVAPETVKLCRSMELSALPAERIMTELEKGLCKSRKPSIFFRVLRDMDQLKTWFPEIEKLIGLRQDPVYHPEGDVWEHTIAVTASIPAQPVLRWAAFLHDIGKPHCFSLDDQGVGHFYGHGARSTDIAETVLRRLRFDNATRERVVLLIKHHDTPLPREEKGIKRLMNRLGVDASWQLLQMHRADTAGQHPDCAVRYAELDGVGQIMQQIVDAAACFAVKDLAINGSDLLALGFQGREIGQALQDALNAVIDGAVPNERQALIAFVQR